MEKVIITINGAYAKEKAETVRELVAEQLAANGITGTSVCIEKQLHVMSFAAPDRLSGRGGTYG